MWPATAHRPATWPATGQPQAGHGPQASHSPQASLGLWPKQKLTNMWYGFVFCAFFPDAHRRSASSCNIGGKPLPNLGQKVPKIEPTAFFPTEKMHIEEDFIFTMSSPLLALGDQMRQ